MDLLRQTDNIFFNKAGLDLVRTQKTVCDALAHADDGELFLEMRHSEMLMFSSSPSIAPFDHPVYDIWLVNCY